MTNVPIQNLPIRSSLNGNELIEISTPVPSLPGTYVSNKVPAATVAGIYAGLPVSSNQSANTILAGPSSGAAAAPTFRALVVADLPTVTVPFGGTGRTTLTNHGLLVGAAAAAINQLAAAAVGTLLTGQGASADPSFSTTPTLGASGTLGSLTFGNATSGTVTVQPVTGALGSVTLSLPAATDQLIARATTDTLTNKTYDTAGTGNVLKINGTQVSATTGSGSTVALSTSPVLVTPALGTPSSGIMTNVTGLPLTSGVSGILPVANGGTNASSAGITAFNNITGYTASGATGTTSTNLVFSTSPILVTPTLGVASATSVTATSLIATATTGETLTLAGNAHRTYLLPSAGAIYMLGTAGTSTRAIFDDTQTTFYSANSAVGAIGLLAPGTWSFFPDGTNTRVAISSTSMQLHYDNVILGRDNLTTASGQGPNMTWKSPQAVGANAAYASFTGKTDGNNAFQLAVGGTVITTNPFEIYTLNGSGTSVLRASFTNGAVTTSLDLTNCTFSLGGSTSGKTIIQATAVAGSGTLTLPTSTDTLVGKATTDTLTNKTITGLALTAGTNSVAPITFSSGTNLTSPVAGAGEFDGVQDCFTIDTTSGRGARPVEQYFHLTAAGSTISTIANYFGTTSNISLVASAYYIIDIYCWFLNTTAGTVVWTFTNSAAPTSQNIFYEMSPITGIVAPPGTATALVGQIYNDATATKALSATGTLTDATNQYMHTRIYLQNGTGTSLKIQATKSAGSITPGINSYWLCRRISPSNMGTFAA